MHLRLGASLFVVANNGNFCRACCYVVELVALNTEIGFLGE